ncbi:MAG TPA: NfeD family protein [bacterium]|nr:NfeD family protein [bacterium]
MHPVVWWIATAVVFFILELTTASFFFLWIGAGAFLTAILSLFVDKAPVEYLTFIISSLLLVGISRRWAPRLSGKTQRAANVDALIGQTAVVTKVDAVQPFLGYAKVGGEAWKIESENQEPLTMGGKTIVASVKGNILVVKV